LHTRIIRVRPARSPFVFRAGQAAEIGPAAASAVTPYSIACAPEEAMRDEQLEFLIKLDSHGRWGEHYELPRRGQPLRLRGPFGSFIFPDHPLERDFLFIGGGTGIAPLRAMIRHASTTRVKGTFRLLYSARTPHDFAYRRELCGMARRGEIDLTLTATRDVPTGWRGGRGRISRSQLEKLVARPETRCFVCGPTAMVDEVPALLRELGIDRSRIQVEEW
jgi:ferredoxin-NADP reductase